MTEKIVFGHTWKSFVSDNPNHTNNINDWGVTVLEIYINLADFPQATPTQAYIANIMNMQDGMWAWDSPDFPEISKRWWSSTVNEKVRDAFIYCKNNNIIPLVCFGHNEEQTSWLTRSPGEDKWLWLELMAEEFAEYIKATWGFARADVVSWNEANECQSANTHANITYHLNKGWKKIYPTSWTHGFNSNLREQNFLNDCLAIPKFVQSVNAVSFHILTNDEWDTDLINNTYAKCVAKGLKVTWLEVSPLGDMSRLNKLLGRGEIACAVLLIRNSLIGQGEGIELTDLLIYYFDNPNAFESVNQEKMDWLKEWASINTKRLSVTLPATPPANFVLAPDTNLTANFKWGEFWSNNFGLAKVEPPMQYYDNILHVAQQLQIVRDKLNADFPVKEKKITITSGYRTPAWNASKSVEGTSNSDHIFGKGADSRASGVPLKTYYAYLLRYTDLNHFGYYGPENFIHAGIRDKLLIFK